MALDRSTVTDRILPACRGGLAVSLYECSGLGTWIHEQGHVLAANLTYSFGASKPHVRMLVWERVHTLVSARSLDAVNAALRALNPFGGGAFWAVTYIPGNGVPTALGRYLGIDGRAVFIFLAGSLPGYGINSIAMLSGVALWRRSRKISATLIGASLVGHITNCIYPIHAALMNASSLAGAARQGHDFASIATHVSAITAYSPRLVAVSVAVAWVATLPLLAYALYRLVHSKKTHL